MQRITDGLRKRARGYSLIEVLIAMALLSTTILAIMTLFFMGRGNVYSGKQMSQGVAVATRVSEDISSMSVPDLYTAFNISDVAPVTAIGNVTVSPNGGKITLPENTYASSVLRTTEPNPSAADGGFTATYAAANDAGGYLTRWRNLMVNENKFTEPSVALVITPRYADFDPPAAQPAATFENATMVRVRILVRWLEGRRPRQVILDTNKSRRPLPD
jgi:prepilin-type N-terminal cleavage/methylation domain-containing protein